MGKVTYSPGIQYVQGAMSKPKKVDGHRIYLYNDILIRSVMNRGESVESIDELYLGLKRLSEEDIVQIHQFMKIRIKPKVEVKEGGSGIVSDKP